MIGVRKVSVKRNTAMIALLLAGGGGIAAWKALGKLHERVAWRFVGAPNYGKSPQDFAAPADVVGEIESSARKSDARLISWVFDPPSPDTAPRGTVLILHGIYDKKTTMVGFARILAKELEVRSVTVDLRGHGESSGDFLTYGIREASDLAALLDELERRQLLVDPVAVYGPSFGASAAIQLAQEERRVQTVVAVAGFASLQDMLVPFVDHFHPKLAPFLPPAWADSVLTRANALSGVDLQTIDNTAAVRESDARFLFMHGANDEIIPVADARRLFEACGPTRCRLVVFPSKNHAESMSGSALRSETLAWIGAGLAQPGAAEESPGEGASR